MGTNKSINELDHLAQTSAKNAVEYAIRCGIKLTAKKKELKHGEWLAWLEGAFDASQPTAFRYMKIAANYSSVNNLPEGEQPASIRAALRQLGAREPGDKGGKKDVIPFSGEYEWYTPQSQSREF